MSETEFTFASMVPLRDDVLGLPYRIQDLHHLHGPGPTKAICKHCNLLLSSYGHTAKTYYKCTLSKMTHGPGTDWRVRWPACGAFETKETE